MVRTSFHEGSYFRFGLKAGLANLFRNGFKLGLKRTLGKIFQPIDFYFRFPQFFFIQQGLDPILRESWHEREPRILDVGGPKLLGLYLAWRFPVKVWLTDISPHNVDEYRIMWRALSRRAKGEAVFEVQDGRRLTYPDEMFDAVYALGVIEHVENGNGDSLAMAEMVRVLRPGGRLVLSVPYAPTYVEQLIRGLKGALVKTKDKRLYFYQRVYTLAGFNYRILRHQQHMLQQQRFVTILRRRLRLVRFIHWLRFRLGDNVVGMAGILNPLLSKLCNAASSGAKSDFFSRVTPIYDRLNFYADLIYMAMKKPAKR